MNPERFRAEVEALLRASPTGQASVALTLSLEVQHLARPDSLAKSASAFVADYYQKFLPPQPEWRSFARVVQHAHGLLVAQASAAENWKMECDPDTLDAFPAAVVLVVEQENEPAGWHDRWAAVGGRIVDGRALALRRDPVWVKFSAYGLPYPPFEWSGSLGIEIVDRDEAEAGGLL